jgi:hypothetical protein
MNIVGALALFCTVWGMAMLPVMILKLLKSKE